MAINFQPIYILASGGERALEQLDSVTNNISNANTNGFKKVLIRQMSQKIYENQGQIADLLVFPRFLDSPVLASQGNLIKTDSQLDVAISRDGFFTVQSGDRRVYTRDGHFSISRDGFLINQNGDYILDEDGNRIKLSTDGRIDITKEGVISQNGQNVAKLRVVNLSGIKHLGNSYYSGQEMEAKDYTISQGYLEASNVDIINQMVQMVESHRRFDMYMNLAKSLDMLESKVNEIGKA